MKLVKSLLLSAPAAVMAFGVANAADLPSRKSAPVSYVKICDAYGAGFFYIPGTDTCLKVGGYVRAEYSYSPSKTVTTAGAGAFVNTPAKAEDELGWRVRGRVDMDARTQSAYGTVSTVIALRLQSRTGLASATATGAASGTTGSAGDSNTAVEAAFVQFAGFTAGRAGENFSFMPGSTHYFNGSMNWASFPTGIKQLAYTATFGGGFSATLALEDRADLTNTFGVTAVSYATPGLLGGGTSAALTQTIPNRTPMVVGNVRLDQSWGSAQVMGAVSKNETTIFSSKIATLPTASSVSKTGYAIGGGVKFNLPMIAAGDQLWLTAAYTEGLLDFVGYTTSNGSDQFNSLRGFVRNDNGLVVVANGTGTNVQKGQEKAFALGAIFTHYWMPSLRSNFMASYAEFTPPGVISLGSLSTANGGLSKAKITQVQANLIWSPVTGLDIGAEVAYRNLKQSVDATYTPAVPTQTTAGFGTVSPNEFSGRVRVQRSF